MSQRDLMTDRVLAIAFAVSIGAHLALLLGRVVSLRWLSPPAPQATAMVYEEAAVKAQLEALQDHLERLKREVAVTAAPPTPGGETHIRIPTRPHLAPDALSPEALAAHAAVVDLTDLVNAARGNPVLLTYFGALREQIQLTANRQTWLGGAPTEGLIYVSFVLLSSGAVQRVEVLSERSVPSEPLREAALRIVKTSSPFPPFPPSMPEATKTVMVPLEFLLGS